MAEFTGDDSNKKKKRKAPSGSGNGADKLVTLQERVRQLLEPYTANGNGNNSSVRRFVTRIESGKKGDVDLTEFRKVLYALGVSADETAYLLDRIDRKSTGNMSSKRFMQHFLKSSNGSDASATAATNEDDQASTIRTIAGRESLDTPPPAPAPASNDEPMQNRKSSVILNPNATVTATNAVTITAGAAALTIQQQQATKDFHQKVIDRILVKYHSVKDAFRQYDSDKSGTLTYGQCRSFLKELGFVNTQEVDNFIKYLDASNNQRISFNAFAATGSSNSYLKSPQKKKIPSQAPPQPLTKSTAGSSPSKALASTKQKPVAIDYDTSSSSSSTGPHAGMLILDPMEAIRTKFRQRVMGKSRSIREVFEEQDLDHNGCLDHDEFKLLMKKYGFTEKEAEFAIDFLDKDHSQTIDYDEFSAGLLFYRPPPGSIVPIASILPAKLGTTTAAKAAKVKSKASNQISDTKQVLRLVGAKLEDKILIKRYSRGDIQQFFTHYDTEQRGYLDLQEFSAFLVGALGLKLNPSQITTLVRLVDKDANGQIEFEEFAALFSSMDVIDEDNEQEEEEEEDEDEEEEEVLRGVFNKYDIDGSGQLDQKQFDQLMKDFGFSSKEVREVLKQLDTSRQDHNHNQDEIISSYTVIDYDTFASIATEKKWDFSHSKKTPSQKKDNLSSTCSSSVDNWISQALQQYSSLEEAFHAFDCDGSGALDHEAFRQLMKQFGINSPRVIDELLQALDAAGSGSINLQEFTSIFFQPSKLQKKASMMIANQNGPLVPAATAQRRVSQISQEEVKRRLGVLKQLEIEWMEEVLQHHVSMENAFNEFDTDQSGELDYEQFRDLMGAYGISDETNVSLLLRKLDVDNSGTIGLEEFLQVFNPSRLKPLKKKASIAVVNKKSNSTTSSGGKKHSISSSSSIVKSKKNSVVVSLDSNSQKKTAARYRELEENWIRQAIETHGSIQGTFRTFDRAASGELDHEEFTRLMNAFGIQEENHIQVLLRRLDMDESGTIDFDEFHVIFHTARVQMDSNSSNSNRKHKDQQEQEQQQDDDDDDDGDDDKDEKEKEEIVENNESKRARAIRLRDLEVAWIKRVVNYHGSIEKAFHEYDRDNSGELDHEEFTNFMKRYGITRKEDIGLLIRRLDLNGSGTIDFEELSTIFNVSRLPSNHSRKTGHYRNSTGHTGDDLDEGCDEDDEQFFGKEEIISILEIERELAERMMQETRDLRLAFRRFDTNGNGRLEYQEFRAILKTYKFPEKEIRKVIRHLDRDVSGYIDYKEFMAGFTLAPKNCPPTATASSTSTSTSTGTGTGTGTGTPSTSSTNSSKKMRVVHAKDRRRKSTTGRDKQEERIDYLKRCLLTRLLSSHLTVQSAFEKYDLNGQGSLKEKEFQQLMQDHGFQHKDIRLLFDFFDQDKSKSIEYNTFMNQFIVIDTEKKKKEQEEKNRQDFRLVDGS